MSLFKSGKNRQIPIEPNELKVCLYENNNAYHKINNETYFYKYKDTLGLSKLPNYIPKLISSSECYYKYVGQILGITPRKKTNDINSNNIGEFFWFSDIEEYTDEYYDLVDSGQAELPVCNYLYGLNKRIRGFI